MRLDPGQNVRHLHNIEPRHDPVEATRAGQDPGLGEARGSQHLPDPQTGGFRRRRGVRVGNSHHAATVGAVRTVSPSRWKGGAPMRRPYPVSASSSVELSLVGPARTATVVAATNQAAYLSDRVRRAGAHLPGHRGRRTGALCVGPRREGPPPAARSGHHRTGGRGCTHRRRHRLPGGAMVAPATAPRPRGRAAAPARRRGTLAQRAGRRSARRSGSRRGSRPRAGPLGGSAPPASLSRSCWGAARALPRPGTTCWPARSSP